VLLVGGRVGGDVRLGVNSTLSDWGFFFAGGWVFAAVFVRILLQKKKKTRVQNGLPGSLSLSVCGGNIGR
jgi:hypothetical protein